MKRSLVLCLSAGIALASCGKKSNNNTPTSNSSDNSYQPTETGSTWTYGVTEVFNPSSSIILLAAEKQLGVTFKAIDTSWTSSVTASGKDTTVGGLSYSILAGATSAQNMYIAVQGTNYYGVGIIPAFSLEGVGSLVTSLPILYLKDTAVNATWTQTVIAPGTTDTTTYTITVTATGGQRTVNGTKYIDVITETVSAIPSGLTALAAANGVSVNTLAINGTYYFAKGIGLIELDVDDPNYGFTFTETLTSSTIK